MNLLLEKYQLVDDIYTFKSKDKNFIKIQKFYNKNPFPNYEINDDRLSILKKGNQNLLVKNLKNKIGLNKSILEVGSGTCQLSNYMAIGTNNKIYALDATLESLKLGLEFTKKNKINNVFFVNGNIFDDIFKHETFDYILCNGVLHHTGNTVKAFEQIIKYLKKDGYIVLGLYNKLGRIRTNVRRFLYKILGKKIVFILDPVIRELRKNPQINKNKIDAWLQDQYEHPIEDQHFMDEVLQLFKKNNIKFVSSIPNMNSNIYNSEDLFVDQDIGPYFIRIFKQFLMNFQKYGAEGGLFVIIGKKCV
tara:strand:- start:89 stop:1003 length:915 start_codon:yes stop_codon:yes gene_type:complete